MYLLLGNKGAMMAMKKKKVEKNTNLKYVDKKPARKTVVKVARPVSEPPHPALAGIGRSLGSLMDRTKAYFLPAGKSEA